MFHLGLRRRLAWGVLQAPRCVFDFRTVTKTAADIRKLRNAGLWHNLKSPFMVHLNQRIFMKNYDRKTVFCDKF